MSYTLLNTLINVFVKQMLFAFKTVHLAHFRLLPRSFKNGRRQITLVSEKSRYSSIYGHISSCSILSYYSKIVSGVTERSRGVEVGAFRNVSAVYISCFVSNKNLLITAFFFWALWYCNRVAFQYDALGTSQRRNRRDIPNNDCGQSDICCCCRAQYPLVLRIWGPRKVWWYKN